jgi:hypothetical protein
MKLRFTMYAATMIAALGFASIQANAALILTPSDADYSGSETSQNDINDAIGDIMGFDDPNDFELYKQNVGENADTGPAAPYYETTFSNSESDPSDALIEWVGGLLIDPNATKYLLVKDGNQDPAWYLFDISDWNGTEDIVLQGFWPDQGAISHVAIYGDNGDGPDLVAEIPEPASAVFWLTVGTAGLFATRRRRSIC